MNKKEYEKRRRKGRLVEAVSWKPTFGFRRNDHLTKKSSRSRTAPADFVVKLKGMNNKITILIVLALMAAPLIVASGAFKVSFPLGFFCLF